VAGGWRRLHIEEPHNLYASENSIRMIKSRRVRWAGYVAHIDRIKYVYGKPSGKRPLGKPGRRWENNRTDLRETDWEGYWMHLT
jgi:hypothetical protein